MTNSNKIKLNQIFFSSKGIDVFSIYEVFNEQDNGKSKKEELENINNFDLKGIKDNSGSIEFDSNPEQGFYQLRLKEIKEYIIDLNSKDTLYLELSSSTSKYIHRIKNNLNLFSLKVINYLGKSFFYIKDNTGKILYKIDFEIVPDKIDYEKDYVKLTEDIADCCSALLLDYASPTNLTYKDDPAKQQRTPLESFIFLRKFCSDDNIETIFSNIKNNPDSQLFSEEEMKPFGTAPVSKKIFSNPFSNARMWTDIGNGKYIPQFTNTTRKFDSLDTIANRFIKFAFNRFVSVCDDVISHLTDKNSTYVEEAKNLKTHIENILNDSFFTDVQDLQQMPNNNQVLQKREGYYQVFSAFAMLDLARKLDWKGQDKVYEGEAKNTALLYEYWLAFQLIDILKSKEIGGKFEIGTSHEDMIQQDEDGKLLINLKEGKESKLSFNIEHRGIKIDFYYNRIFTREKFNNSIYKNSYSRPFRPDYTLAIYPSSYKKEADAIKDGLVSFVHFDAKYRVNNIMQLFGKRELQEDDFNEEKSDSSIDTYKRGDLLKMHTYNDAIRKTIGSYILYPGTETSPEIHKIYDELLPGVGAFSIKPSNVNNGKNAIKGFILKIIKFKSKLSSKQYRKNYFENIVINTPTDSYIKELDEDNKHTKPLNHIEEPIQQYGTNLYMIGFMRKEYIEKLEKLGKIPKDANIKISKDDYFYFYYHAIEQNGVVQAIHKDINKATKFCAYDKNFKILNFEAKVDSIELVDKETLINKINEYDNSKKDHKALYYYIVKLTNIEYKEHTEMIDIINDFRDYGISPFTPIVKCL